MGKEKEVNGMTTYQKTSLTLAILSAFSFAGVGFAVSERNGMVALIFIILGIIFVGTGFILKRRARKNGTL
jgi:uncharacterized membrane protein